MFINTNCKKIIGLFLILSCFFSLSKTARGETTTTFLDLEKEISSLNNKISDQQNKIKTLNAKIDRYERRISEKQNEKKSLENEIDILNLEIEQTNSKVEIAQAEMEEVNLKIQNITFQILEKELSIQDKKKFLAYLIKQIDKSDQQTPLETFIVNKSFSAFLGEIETLNSVEQTIIKSLSFVKESKNTLLSQRIELQTASDKLNDLHKQLKEQKKTLADQQDIKEYLVVKTAQSEKEYQSLLDLAKKDQESIYQEITSLEGAIRDKIKQKNLLGLSKDGFIWPVDPSRGITAYFHDPDYPYRSMMEHAGVDVRAYQGTEIMASADAYVGRLKTPKQAGKGLSYIFLIHGDGLSTAYLHLSAVYVSEGDYVKKGDVIGLSGGSPGTNGAGNLTTGPHLHFEIRKDGIPADPMKYLP